MKIVDKTNKEQTLCWSLHSEPINYQAQTVHKFCNEQYGRGVIFHFAGQFTGNNSRTGTVTPQGSSK
jgi:hypothetical protein